MLDIYILALGLILTQYSLTSLNCDIIPTDYIYGQLHSLALGFIACQLIQIVLRKDDKTVCASAGIFSIASLILGKYSAVKVGLSV